MKKTVIASLAVLASAAVLTTFALGGAGKFGNVRANAEPKEYSVTFDGSESTTVEEVDGNYAIGTTTASGNKVGVMGFDNSEARITFNGVSFGDLILSHYEMLVEGDAYEFSTITGFAISFSIEYAGDPEPFSVTFTSMGTVIGPVESGHEYKGLSITPHGDPMFEATVEEGDSVNVSSLTIWYSC